MNKSRNGSKVREFPKANVKSENIQQVGQKVELGVPAPKGGPVPEGWTTYMLYFVDFASGLRIPIVSKEDPNTVEKWARQLKPIDIDGRVASGTSFKQLAMAGPVAYPPERDFNPSSIVLPKQEVKPVSKIILK